jgi:hypothetical protein
MTLQLLPSGLGLATRPFFGGGDMETSEPRRRADLETETDLVRERPLSDMMDGKDRAR